MAFNPKTRQLQRTPVNLPATTIAADFSRFLVQRSVKASAAPIDDYYDHATFLLKEASSASCSDWHRQLLTVALVADVELYVRSVVVGLVWVCPSSQKAAQRKPIALASVDYYPAMERALAIFDHQALSGAKGVTTTVLQVLNIEVKQNAPAWAALAEYDRVCQLRHSIVHQAGRVTLHNAIDLELPSLPAAPVVVSIDVVRFQDLVAVCHSAVRALNQHLFDATTDRWQKDALLTMNWKTDAALFRSLVTLFHSKSDVPDATAELIYVGLGGTI